MKSIKKILVTGSAGFIGSTFCYEALKKGFEVMGIDNYSNSKHFNTKILKDFSKNFSFQEIDIANNPIAVKDHFKEFQPDLVIHLASLKSVQESKKNPSLYWKNNLGSTDNILESMSEISCKNLIFSSSASVYSPNNDLPLTETSDLAPLSIYGETKLACEKLIHDNCEKEGINAVIFRYFNLCGAHKEKLFFETSEISESLMTKIIDVAEANREFITVYGNNHLTKDGTASRDFIHIDDLLNAHFTVISSFNKLNGFEVFNLSTGKETTVLSMLEKFQEMHKISIEYIIGSPSDEEISRSFASAEKIDSFIGWKAKKTIDDICTDSWGASK